MTAFSLVGFSIVSYLIKYATSIVLARALGVERYDAYAVAVASLVLLATFAELGLGKYGLKALPAYLLVGELRLARAFVRFSLQRVLVVSLLAGGALVLGEAFNGGHVSLRAPWMVALFLPFVAWAGVGSEFLMATGKALAGTLIARVLIPVVPLLFVLWASFLHPGEGWLEPSVALFVYGLGWLLGGIALITLAPRALFGGEKLSLDKGERRKWLQGGLGMASVALAISGLFEGSLILSDFIDMPESDVAIYAVCMETGGFSYILVKSLDKFYMPMISRELLRLRVSRVIAIRRRRNRLMVGVCSAFIIALFLFGRQLLGLFGTGFERGYWALLLIAVGTIAWTLTSLSQWFLVFVRGSTYVLRITIPTLLSLVAAGLFFGPTYGVTGMALIYSLLMVSMCALMEWRARKELSRLPEGTSGNSL